MIGFLSLDPASQVRHLLEMIRSAWSKTSIIASIVLGWVAQAGDQPAEILIHEGPVFTTPGLEPKEEIKFIKEFPVDAGTLKKQRFLMLTDKLPISAGKAIELAKASADAGALGRHATGLRVRWYCPHSPAVACHRTRGPSPRHPR